MTKSQWKIKTAIKIYRNKIMLEQEIRKDLKNYFKYVKIMLSKGEYNNFSSIKSVIKKHNARVMNKIITKRKKDVDFVKLYTVLDHVNEKRIHSDSMSIDDTTHKRIHDSIDQAKEQLKKDGIENTSSSMINKVASRIFENYSNNRINGIAITETTRLYENARRETVKQIQPLIKDAIYDEDYDELDDLEDVSDSYQMEDARRQLEDDNDKYDIVNSVIGALTKTWVTMRDDKVREDHADADGQTVGINETFNIGGYDMFEPGDESLGAGLEEICNCRCFVMYGV